MLSSSENSEDRADSRQEPDDRQILAECGSFSAVSAPIFASKYTFYSIFLDLQDYLAEFSKIAKL